MPAPAPAQSKFFRVATEGDTTDGRVIDRSMIQQMADGYDQAKYGARIFLEHIRGIFPDGPFRAYGDVTAVKSGDVTLDGKNRLALFAQIDATPDLVALAKARQKIYTSIEVDPNFAKTGQAYLTGLGITDSPASLGVEMLKFAAGAQPNPLTARKQRPENLFSAAQEVVLEWEDPPAGGAAAESLFTKVKELLTRKTKRDDEQLADVTKAVETLAGSQREMLDQFADMQRKFSAAVDAAAADRQAFADLKAQLDKEPSGKTRPPASGGGGAPVTDC